MLLHQVPFIAATLEPIMPVCQRHFILMWSAFVAAASFLFVVAVICPYSTQYRVMVYFSPSHLYLYPPRRNAALYY